MKFLTLQDIKYYSPNTEDGVLLICRTLAPVSRSRHVTSAEIVDGPNPGGNGKANMRLI